MDAATALIRITSFTALAVLAVLWARSGDGGYEPWTVICGVVGGGLELGRRYVLRDESVSRRPPKESKNEEPSSESEMPGLEWLLANVPAGPLSGTLPRALILAKTLGDSDFERWVLCELNGYSPETMNETDMVPEYRTIPVVHLDSHNRPIAVHDPNLAFINKDRPRFGVRELEAYAEKDGMLYARDEDEKRGRS